MLLVGLTGGIGSGKTTVARMLETRGAVVLDADEFARRALDPGTEGFRRVVELFGPEVESPEGTIDRGRVAELVFEDEALRGKLEGIVHPEVARRFAEAVEPYRATDRVVVYVVPLLAERHLEGGFDFVVAVSAAPDVRTARLRVDRNMDPEDARARMAAQASDAKREAIAHAVLRNDGSIQELEVQVDRLWNDLRRRTAGGD